MAATANWTKHKRTRPSSPTTGNNRSKITVSAEAGGILILTESQWKEFFHFDLEDVRGDLKTVGLYDTPISYRAPTVCANYVDSPYGRFAESYTLYGWRVLSGCYSGVGGSLTGMVTVGNRKRSAYTGSVLVQIKNDSGSVLHTLESAAICLRAE